MQGKIYIKIFLALVVFVISVAAYYYPVHKKGYAPGADHQNLMEARNFALAGTYRIENSTGVLLSSESAKQSGVEKGIFNPLTPIIYGQVFKSFGFKPDLPLHVSIVLFSLFNVLIFLLAKRLFGLVVGFVSAIACVFLPVMAVGAIHGGFYEWAMIFFVLGLWFYLGSKKGPFQADGSRVLIASVFFGLAALSRNAFAISFVPLFLHDFFIHRAYKRSLTFLVPFIIIFGSTLTPVSWLGVPNSYYTDIEHQSFDLIGHFFRDPYSYFYDKENYIKEMSEKGLNRVGVLFATQWGYDVSFSERISAYKDSLGFYIRQIIDLTSTGGPLILGLMFLGLIHLYNVNKRMFGLFSLWGLLWMGYLVYDKTGNWDHVMEIAFVLAVLIGLGLYRLVELLSLGSLKKMAAASALIILFVGHMGYATKWRLHDIYRSSNEELVLTIADQLRKQPNLSGTYAVGIHPASVYSLNYRLNHDVVYFDSKTIESLLAREKLQEAFNTYGITAVVGYDDDLTSEIQSQTGVRALP